jgi:integrase
MSGTLSQSSRRQRPDTEPVEAATARLSPKRNAYGKWEVHYSERDAQGKIHSAVRSAKTGDRLEAERFLRDFQATYRGHAIATTRTTPTFDVVAARYVEHLRSQGKTASMEKALIWPRRYWGDKLPEDLNTQLIEDYAAKRRAHCSGRHKGYSPNTLHMEMTAVRAALKLAVRKKLLLADELPDDFDQPPAGAGRDVWLDRDTEARVFARAKVLATAPDNLIRYPSQREAALFICLALETGCRWQAAMDLTWDRIDLSANPGKIDFNVPGRARTTKKRVSGMPVSDSLRPVLEHAKGRAADPLRGRVFLTNPRKAFQGIMDALGLDHVTPHALRHTAATLKAQAGASIPELAALLGNTPDIVAKVYMHHGPEHLLSVINRTSRT